VFERAYKIAYALSINCFQPITVSSPIIRKTTLQLIYKKEKKKEKKKNYVLALFR